MNDNANTAFEVETVGTAISQFHARIDEVFHDLPASSDVVMSLSEACFDMHEATGSNEYLNLAHVLANAGAIIMALQHTTPCASADQVLEHVLEEQRRLLLVEEEEEEQRRLLLVEEEEAAADEGSE